LFDHFLHQTVLVLTIIDSETQSKHPPNLSTHRGLNISINITPVFVLPVVIDEMEGKRWRASCGEKII
jgi:hypothetical protein